MSQKDAGKLGDIGQVGQEENVKVLILGAGAAGLAAASTLLSKGVDQFLVIEGAAHFGGRVHDVEFGGVRVEKGANWLQPIDGPMAKIARKAGLQCQQEMFTESKVEVKRSNGKDVPQTEVEQLMEEFCDVMIEAGHLSSSVVNTGLSVRDFMLGTFWPRSSDSLRKTIEWFLFDFEYTVPPEQASVDEGHWGRVDTSGFVLDQRGFKTIFANVVSRLAQKNRLLLNKRVTKIDQSQTEKAYVTCDDGSVFCADTVLVTFSLGVLQNRLVVFDPPLPEWKTAAIDHMPMGAFTKIFLKFPRNFWGNQGWILHQSEKKGYYPAFKNMEAPGLFPSGTNILVAFVVGEEAKRVENQPQDKTRVEILTVLRGMYGEHAVPNPTEMLISGWLNDPLQMGSFSAPLPPGIPRPSKLIHHLQSRVGRIYFSGEATDEKFAGFVAGGLRSGQREARKIICHVLKDEVKKKVFAVD